jgi:hypothetical protein
VDHVDAGDRLHLLGEDVAGRADARRAVLHASGLAAFATSNRGVCSQMPTCAKSRTVSYGNEGTSVGATLSCARNTPASTWPSGGLDCSAFGEPPPLPGLVARRLSDGEYLNCASPASVEARGAPQRPEDLQAHVCLAYVAADGRAHVDRSFADDLQRVELRVRPLLAVNDGPALVAAALAGQGVVHLPALNLAPQVARGALVRLLPGWFSGAAAVHVLVAPGRRDRPAVRAFVEFVVASFEDLRPGSLSPPAAHRPRRWPMHRLRRARGSTDDRSAAGAADDL